MSISRILVTMRPHITFASAPSLARIQERRTVPNLSLTPMYGEPEYSNIDINTCRTTTRSEGNKTGSCSSFMSEEDV
jgi:hypothetical protein